MDQTTSGTIGGTPSKAAGGFAGSAAPSGEAEAGACIAGSTHLQDRSGPGPEIMAASSFEGETVVNGQGETLGEIEEIMLDVRSGRIAYAVMSVGGFLGIGEKYFAIPWNALVLDTDHKRFVLDVDKDRLQNAPGFDRNQWPSMADPQWAGDLHNFYGTPPYWE